MGPSTLQRMVSDEPGPVHRELVQTAKADAKRSAVVPYLQGDRAAVVLACCALTRQRLAVRSRQRPQDETPCAPRGFIIPELRSRVLR